MEGIPHPQQESSVWRGFKEHNHNKTQQPDVKVVLAQCDAQSIPRCRGILSMRVIYSI